MKGTAEQMTTHATAEPSPVAFAEPSTLPEMFRRAVAEYDLPDALNYKSDGEWRAISSRQFLARSETVALGLTTLGLKHGDRVAILAANSPDWTIADAACPLA